MTLHSSGFRRKVTYESLNNSSRSGTPPPPSHGVIEFTTPHLIMFHASRKALCRWEGLRWRSPAPQAAVLRTQIECLDLNSHYFCSRIQAIIFCENHRTLTTVGSMELWSFLFVKRRGLRLAYVAQSHAMLGRSCRCLGMVIHVGSLFLIVNKETRS